MLLFGKTSFRASPGLLVARLGEKVAATAEPSLERAREWLVLAGMIEQAVLDSGGNGVCRITDAAAQLFLSPGDAAFRAGLLREIAAFRGGEADAEVRVPEGFAWYALYPDSYAVTAARWAEGHPRAKVLVAGIRSIGTGLSAVVTEVLRRSGAAAERVTVRPEGHPFRRRCEVAGDGDFFIIVDEGPGLSGSSMASVAEALATSGVREEAIVFFPGHGKGPGPEASEAVRRWWRAERCFVSPAPEGLFNPAPDVTWSFGGFAAVNAKLETLAEVKRKRQNRLAGMGLALPSPAAANGWIAISNAGMPLERKDLDAVLRPIAHYIAAAACVPEDEQIFRQAAERIAEALQAYGHETRLAARIAACCTSLPLAGDGRMAPFEWVRLEDGRVLKRDATGTDCDHTWAGPQSVLWDVAGAMIEWEMDAPRAAQLLAALQVEGIAAEPLALAYHRAGYCCLRLAQARHGGDDIAAARYEAVLRGALSEMEVLA